MNVLEEITAWYSSYCDGDSEHSYGVKIDTLDNPGWLIKIDLLHTDPDGKAFTELLEGVDPSGHSNEEFWIHCSVRDNQFVGAGDPSKIARILRCYLDWAKE